jgi:prepilin-type N-terminal cleavage/methylation domain-containing protein
LDGGPRAAYNGWEAMMTMRTRSTLGMTLVELMIVVVIIGILAAIAVVGYRKYIARARTSEATAMLAEFAAKEQLYFLDNGQYVEAHQGALSYPSEETAADFWPRDPSVTWDSAREPASVNDSAGKPLASWRSLGVRPRWNQLFCTYFVNAGPPGVAPPSGSEGAGLWGTVPNVAWFYALGVCNLSGQAGWPNSARQVTVMALTHDSPQIRTTEESQ